MWFSCCQWNVLTAKKSRIPAHEGGPKSAVERVGVGLKEQVRIKPASNKLDILAFFQDHIASGSDLLIRLAHN